MCSSPVKPIGLMWMRTLIFSTAMLLLIAWMAGLASAQALSDPLDARNPPRAWIGVSGGVGSGAGSAANGSVGAHLNIGWPASTTIGQVAVHTNWSTQSRTKQEDLPYAVTAGIGGGRVWARRDIAVAGTAGPGVSWEHTTAGAIRRTAGLLAGGQFFVSPAPGFGFGIDVFAFIHPNQNQIGVRLALQVGSAWAP